MDDREEDEEPWRRVGEIELGGMGVLLKLVEPTPVSFVGKFGFRRLLGNPKDGASSAVKEYRRETERDNKYCEVWWDYFLSEAKDSVVAKEKRS